MQKLYIPGTTKINNEKGSIMVMTIFLVLFLTMLLAGMVEIGRVMIVREQLQTAADSAALAGAGSGTHRYVKINVVTDRGQREVCNKDDCWCTGCSTVTIRNIPGDEKTLIDEGGWREYCVEPCDCGGGDCYFELVSRDLMYDTQSMGWGVSAQELNTVEKELTDATTTSLAGYIYNHSSTINQIFSNKTMTQMKQTLDSNYSFLSAWMATRGYPYDCYADYKGRANPECLAWRSEGWTVYNKLKTKSSNIGKNIDVMKNMRQANSRPINKVDEKYTASAGKFFNANLPANADDAGINKMTVYGYESANNAVKGKYYPSVVVYATANIKTLFPQWFKKDFNTTVCAQGITAYRSAEDQKSKGNKFYNALKGGKWDKVPDDACWVDW